MKFTDNQELAMSLDRHVVVNAGAGSGKTSVLVHRYMRILDSVSGIDMTNIVAITFTKKAAGELKNRLASLIDVQLDRKQKDLWLSQLPNAYISTIHGFCHRLIKKYGSVLDLDPQFVVMDGDQAMIVWNHIMDTYLLNAQLAKNEFLKQFLLHFSFAQLKQDLIRLFERRDQMGRAEDAENELLSDFMDSILEDPNFKTTTHAIHLTSCLKNLFFDCFELYSEWKTEESKYDYSDLMENMLVLLGHKTIRLDLQKKFRFIMVDECQDTDDFQWEIIRLLCRDFDSLLAKDRDSTLEVEVKTKDVKPNEVASRLDEDRETEPGQIPGQNLFLVGDMKQSIYSFRGANPKVYASVLDKLKGANVLYVNLNENFRTQPRVIEGINKLFQSVFPKIYPDSEPSYVRYDSLIACRQQKEGDLFFNSTSIENEPHDMARWMVSKFKDGHSWQDMALLFRRKTRLDVFRDVFESYGIPVQISSQQCFYQRQEIVDMMALLTVLVNPQNNLALLAVLKSPLFNMTDNEIERLYIEVPKFSVLQKLKRSGRKEIQLIYQDILEWQGIVFRKPFPDAVEQVLHRQKIWNKYHESDYDESALKNIQIFLYFIKKHWSENPSYVIDFIRYIKHLLEIGAADPLHPFEEPLKNAVQFMTIHAAKGLEFPIVAVPECHKTFNFSKSDRVVVSRHGIGMAFKRDKGKTENIWRSHHLDLIRDEVIEEEKRIFYVACTRARDSLLLSGDFLKTSEKQEKAKGGLLLSSYFGLLLPEVSTASGYMDYESLQFPIIGREDGRESISLVDVEPRQAKPVINTYSFSGSVAKVKMSVTDCLRYLTCSKLYFLKGSGLERTYYKQLKVEEEAPPEEWQLLPLFAELQPEVTKSKKRSKRASSGLTPQDYGSFIHRLIEWVNMSEPLSGIQDKSLEWLKQLSSFGGVSQFRGGREGVLSFISSFYSMYTASDLAEKIRVASSVYHEHPFILGLDDFCLEGRIDSLIFTGKQWQVIDYKTDQDPDKRQKTYYRKQIGLYLVAAKYLFHLDYDEYRGYLMFTETGTVDTVTYTANELNHLETKLKGIPKLVSTRDFTKPVVSVCEACVFNQVAKNCSERALFMPLTFGSSIED